VRRIGLAGVVAFALAVALSGVTRCAPASAPAPAATGSALPLRSRADNAAAFRIDALDSRAHADGVAKETPLAWLP
jgi:hypothetical protein